MNVRISELGFEGRCETCGEFFPLDAEFWPMKRRHAVRECRDCHAVRIRPARGNTHRAYRRKGGQLDYRAWRRVYKRDWMRRKRATA